MSRIGRTMEASGGRRVAQKASSRREKKGEKEREGQNGPVHQQTDRPDTSDLSAAAPHVSLPRSFARAARALAALRRPCGWVRCPCCTVSTREGVAKPRHGAATVAITAKIRLEGKAFQHARSMHLPVCACMRMLMVRGP